MMRIGEAISNMKASRSGTTVKNWRDMLPPGSRWNPGDPGNPACQVCEGTGYLRMDLPINHPYFGRVFLCDCARETGGSHA